MTDDQRYEMFSLTEPMAPGWLAQSLADHDVVGDLLMWRAYGDKRDPRYLPLGLYDFLVPLDPS